MNQSYANFFQSIIDQDRAAVVICNLEHEIIYMNPAAVHNYEKWGGSYEKDDIKRLSIRFGLVVL